MKVTVKQYTADYITRQEELVLEKDDIIMRKEKEVMLNSLVHWIKNGEFKKDFDEHREMRRIQGVKLKEAKNKK